MLEDIQKFTALKQGAGYSAEPPQPRNSFLSALIHPAGTEPARQKYIVKS